VLVGVGVVSGTWKYDEPEVENVTRAQPSVTFSSEGRPSYFHVPLPRTTVYHIFVVWPTTIILNYKWLIVAKRE